MGAAGLVARLHATLDALLSLDLADVPQADLPGVVTGLVRAGHRVHAAQLDAVGAFDAIDMAAVSRHRTTTRWLEHRTRASAAQAAGLVASARAVRDHLPPARGELATGRISAGHAAAIAAVVRMVGVEHATAAEPVLLQLARSADPAVVRRATAHLHATLDPDAAQARLDKTYAARGVTLSVVGSRAYLDGVLDAEAAETLRAALTPLMAPSPGDTRSMPQRRADALIDLARRALDTGDLPVLGGQRPHLSVVVDAAVLAGRPGAATLPWTGVAVPAPTISRWACDARLTPVVARLLPPAVPPDATRPGTATDDGATGGGWLPLAVGRSSRAVTPAQLKALQVRDGGCVHPGCSRTAAFCDAHHIIHWADGGPTDLHNLALLCRHHHRSLHAGHWQLVPDPARPGQLTVIVRGSHREPAQTSTDRSPPLSPTG
jgi:hypothetical protein